VNLWLEQRLAEPLTARDLLRPSDAPPAQRRRPAVAWLAAASVAMLAIAAWWGAATPGDSAYAPPAPLAEWPAMEPTLDPVPADPLPEIPAVAAGDKVRARWQLNGVAKVGKDSVIVLHDRDDNSTRQLVAGDDVDGWIISDAGPDYAVLTQDGELVRLELVALDAR